MLSVQVPGYAGMERLGTPGGPHLRHEPHIHPTLPYGQQQQLQEMVGRLLEREARARSAAAAELLGLPPSIQLPDGEYGQDAHLQIRVAYQQAELTRCGIQPPPNKSVSDVPEWADVTDAPPPRRSPPGKKDGFIQRAARWWVRIGARPPPAQYLLSGDDLAARLQQRDLRRGQHTHPNLSPAPCVMVPLRSTPLVPPAPPAPPDA